MRIAVFGVGAVGGYFGGRLAQTGHEVIFIARGPHLDAIRAKGLHVQSEQGDFVAHPALATANPVEIGAVDMVVLATKAWQVEAAAAAMQPLVGSDTVIVPLLNGVEAPGQLAAHYGVERVLGGFCRVQSRREAPGRIIQGGTPPFVAIGALSQEGEPQVSQVGAVFEEAGISVHLPESIEAAMWQKLLFIASFGGVGAVTRMPAGVIRTLPETRQMLQEAMTEVVTVARARSIPIQSDAVEQGMAALDRLPDGATASMQRDIMNGYPSELDAQNGAVVRLGQAAAVETPVHRFIYAGLKPSENQSRGWP